jgi:hypothetical protein
MTAPLITAETSTGTVRVIRPPETGVYLIQRHVPGSVWPWQLVGAFPLFCQLVPAWRAITGIDQEGEQ